MPASKHPVPSSESEDTDLSFGRTAAGVLAVLNALVLALWLSPLPSEVAALSQAAAWVLVVEAVCLIFGYVPTLAYRLLRTNERLGVAASRAIRSFFRALFVFV